MALRHSYKARTGNDEKPDISVEDLFVFPASFAQERLWFLDQLEPGSAVYNIAAAFRVKGLLDVASLKRSLEEIVRRHEALRTTFGIADGKAVQIINAAIAVPLPVIALRHFSEAEREAEALRLATAEADSPFDLSQGPLFRAKLLWLADEEHVLVLTMHHVASDGQSMDVLFRELAVLYEAFSQGMPSPLPEVPIQYVDFAVWQREWLRGDVLESQLSYWKHQLGDALKVLELPADRPRPAVQTFRGAVRQVLLPRPLADALNVLGKREGATLFMTLLAAFQVLLSRYTGQEDIPVGTPIAGRTQVETEGLIGFFVNTLVLRTDLSGDPTFRELLTRVREVALGAYAHQDLPFEKLVQELKPERTLSHTPLFQVMFTLQNARRGTLKLRDLSLIPFKLQGRTAKFDLTLSVTNGEKGLLARLEYSSDLFDASTIDRMLGHFGVLLEGIAADPERRLSQLPFLTEAEQHQLLVEWNQTEREYPKEKYIHQFFEEQVERTPDAVAVEFEGKRLTYRELNHRANQLAHRLRGIGVGPEVLVGLCVERSLEMVVGLLGILKAGGAYVPLDPRYPKERLAFMLEDSGATVMLTDEWLAEGVAGGSGRVILPQAVWGVHRRESEENPESGVTAENPAYVIYTSGSTGKPKGVMVPHAGLVNHSFAVAQQYGLQSSDRVLQFASLAFDVAAEEMFPSWLSGATVVLGPDVASTGLREFQLFLERERLTVLNLPATFWHEWTLELSRSGSPMPSWLRLVIVGSEKVLPERLKMWRQRGEGKVRWVNAYGPTEATITTTVYEPAFSGEASDNASVPIGRPVANTQVYILDRNRQPVPIGVPGELHIGGVGLARGYLNRPELTAGSFIPNPFSDNPNVRLYQTGDLARYLPDGNIEYLRRLDHQVKVRGFRIELGEIESALIGHPSVREAVVEARQETSGESRLVAYVVAGPDSVPEVKELRKHLREKLPDYMVPSDFVLLDAFPLTPSGKVNRRALPAPGEMRLESESGFLAARDDLELQIAKVWERVLGVRPIGIRDNFFELGGHSLLAVRLFSEIEKVSGRKLPLATLFQAPTVEQLTRILRREGWTAPWSSLVAIQPHGSKPPLFCVHPGGGHVLYYRDLARHLGPDQPLYGLQVRGLDGQHPTHTRLEDLVADYIKEIRTIQSDGPYFLGGLCAGGIMAFEMAQQLHSQGQRVALLALFDTLAPGYPKLLPDTRSFRYRAYRFFRRIDLEVGNLVLLGPKEKLSYVREKARRVLRRRKQRIKKIAKKSYEAIRHPLPRDLRKVQEFNRRLLRDYVPKVYPGRATLFRASNQPAGYDPDPQLGWGGLVAGGLEIYEVPGYHESIAVEPRVQFLAAHLRPCLEEANPPENKHALSGGPQRSEGNSSES